ncbi:hypothetical protein ACSBR2_018173 [Camellia fascicularis]
MAEIETEVATGQPKKRTFKKFSFRGVRGVNLDALLDMSTDELVKLFTARARRRFQRGLKRKPMALIKKLRKAVNLEYLGRVVFYTNGNLYPDSVVGTDSHTTMIAGWGVGGIESEATMLGQGGNDFEIYDSERTVGHTASASPKPTAAGDSNCNVRNFLERYKIWSKN